MKMNELKKKNEKELQTLLASERAKLLEISFKDASRQLKNVREIRETKKSIARIMTMLNKGVAAEEPAVTAEN